MCSQDFWELFGELGLANIIFSNGYQAYYLYCKHYVLRFI